jgi:hypothetical protein
MNIGWHRVPTFALRGQKTQVWYDARGGVSLQHTSSGNYWIYGYSNRRNDWRWAETTADIKEARKIFAMAVASVTLQREKPE